MKLRLLGVLIAVFFLFLSTAPSAALVDNGGGLIYDDVLDITWAQPDVRRNWADANTWASGLTLGGVSGWRLPYISVAAGGGPFENPVVCDLATEEECRDNELAYLFFHDFGGSFGQPIPPNGDADVLALFPDLSVAQVYWTGTEFDADDVWEFSFFNGGQGREDKFQSNSVWAVHDGSVGGLLFGDGFETGDTTRWSETVP